MIATKKITLSALALAAAAIAAPASALAWDQIGERVVTDRADFDEIWVEGHRRYTAVKLCVYDHPVRFYDLDIRFANGGHQDASIRARINPGECTRVIDLKGGARDIRNVKLVYEEASAARARATVRVFAQ